MKLSNQTDRCLRGTEIFSLRYGVEEFIRKLSRYWLPRQCTQKRARFHKGSQLNYRESHHLRINLFRINLFEIRAALRLFPNGFNLVYCLL